MDNSAFISYRRDVSGYPARAVFQDLRVNGIDVFLDVESIDSGHFETVILNQIAARPYFILMLAPGCLDRCEEPGDWLRREIETAIDLTRIIVPLLTSGFAFDAPYARPFLTGKLHILATFNSVNVPLDYFDEAMTRLRTRFLKPVTLHQTPVSDPIVVQQKIERAAAEPLVTNQQLVAQQFLEKALARPSDDFEGQIDDLSKAIEHDPEFTTAYYHRSLARNALGDSAGAANDYRQFANAKGIGLKPKQAAEHNNQGDRLYKEGALEEALVEFHTAIDLNPRYTTAYFNRACVYRDKGDIDNALADLRKAIELDASYWRALYARGTLYLEQGQHQQACADFQKALDLKPPGISAGEEMQQFVDEHCH